MKQNVKLVGVMSMSLLAMAVSSAYAEGNKTAETQYQSASRRLPARRCTRISIPRRRR